jgi:elongation factor P
MANTTDFRNGFTMTHEGAMYSIVEFQHVKPGKGGGFTRTKLKNMETGAVTERTFRSGDKVEAIRVEKREMQYLYAESDAFHFMDLETYEQTAVNDAVVGESHKFLKESENAFLIMTEGKILGVELPNFVELAVTATDPGVKGDTATNAVKPATLETGAVVSVPLFVNGTDILRIDTRTGQYVERV